MKRLVAIFLVVTVFVFGINGNYVGESVYAEAMENDKEENTDDAKKSHSYAEEKTYIVATKNLEKLRDVKKRTKKGNTITEKSKDYIEKEKLVVVKGSKEKLAELSEEKDVLFVEEDTMVRGFGGKIKNRKNVKCKADGLEWNIRAIKADGIKIAQNEKIKVAVLDSGVDAFNDIELADSINLVPGEEEVSPLFWDVSGHGSSVAGIIAAKNNNEGICGINPSVEIYAAKILSGDNTAPLSRVIEGIYWAIDNDVDIINISFGTPVNSLALKTAIHDAYERGILIIAAAGNTGGKVEYPAAYDEVMAVGSVDTDGIVSDYSARGNEVEIVAPGEQIVSTGGFGGTTVCGGTSMAAPHVTAVASILWQKDKSVSNEFIRQLLNASANGYGKESEYGNGLVDLSYAEKIYNKFKKSFQEKNTQIENEGEIEENTSEVLQFDCVDNVEGTWKSSEHATIVNNETAGTSLSSAAICRIKAGAIYPDLEVSKVKGMGNYPMFHGYFKNDGSNEKSNYINSYVYITKLAEAIREGSTGFSSIPVPQIRFEAVSNQMTANAIQVVISTIDYNEAREAIINKSGSDLQDGFILNGNEKSQRAQFVWGMAIHTATDVYAHCIKGKVGESWVRFYHDKEKNGNDYADNCKKVEERFRVAKQVASNAIKRYINHQSGSYNDFVENCLYDGNCFKLYEFQEYLSVASGSQVFGNGYAFTSTTFYTNPVK